MNDEIGMIATALPIQIACIHIGHFSLFFAMSSGS